MILPSDTLLTIFRQKKIYHAQSNFFRLNVVVGLGIKLETSGELKATKPFVVCTQWVGNHGIIMIREIG